MLTARDAATTQKPPVSRGEAVPTSQLVPKPSLLPIFALFILSPLIAEVLLGATSLTHIGGLAVVAPFYGCGVLLIREFSRPRTASWWPVAVFGSAYMLIEEGLTLQTLFNPDFVNAAKFGGRWLGINGVLTQWELGYHIVWSICIPILITELLFPARRRQRWMGPFGVSICVILYLLAAIILGTGFRKVVMPGFHAPLGHLAITAAIACALVILALTWPKTNAAMNNFQKPTWRPTPPWWLVGLFSAAWAASLFALFSIPSSIRQTRAAGIFMVAQLIFSAVLIRQLKVISTDNIRWTDAHSWALTLGPILISSAFGLFRVTAANQIDQIGVATFAVITLATLLILAIRRAKASSP